MSVFEDFEKEYGPAEDCLAAGEEVIKRYQGRLPGELLDLWREAGWCSYGKGLLWVVDPGQLADVIEDWIEPSESETLVFLRTAFAHLYFWRDGSVYSLDVHHGNLSQVTDDIALMFTLLCDPEIKAKILRASLYGKAAARIGRPNRDECYAFEPALGLGGSEAIETVKRVKLRENLAILAQIHR
jgi:hypothetical protein